MAKFYKMNHFNTWIKIRKDEHAIVVEDDGFDVGIVRIAYYKHCKKTEHKTTSKLYKEARKRVLDKLGIKRYINVVNGQA